MTEQERSRQPNRLLRWFDGRHLPPEIQPVAGMLQGVAMSMDDVLPDGAEKTAGLRKLLEAKDCFVRAKLEAS